MMMNKILDKLSKIATLPKTRHEKLHHWFGRNEKKYNSIGLILAICSGFILFPWIESVTPSHVFNACDYVLIYLLSIMPALVTWMVLGIFLSQEPNGYQTLLKKQKEKLNSYLKTANVDNELKEVLLKMKFISLIYQFNSFNDATHKIQYFIDGFKTEELKEEDLTHLTNLITDEKLFPHICNDTLFNHSSDELKEILAKKIAFKLQKDKEKLEQYDEFVHQTIKVKPENVLFKQAKTLSVNL